MFRALAPLRRVDLTIHERWRSLAANPVRDVFHRQQIRYFPTSFPGSFVFPLEGEVEERLSFPLVGRRETLGTRLYIFLSFFFSFPGLAVLQLE